MKDFENRYTNIGRLSRELVRRMTMNDHRMTAKLSDYRMTIE